MSYESAKSYWDKRGGRSSYEREVQRKASLGIALTNPTDSAVNLYNTVSASMGFPSMYTSSGGGGSTSSYSSGGGGSTPSYSSGGGGSTPSYSSGSNSLMTYGLIGLVILILFKK